MAHDKIILRSLAIDPESTFATPASSAYSDYVNVPAESIEYTPGQEYIERDVQTLVLGQKVSGLVGRKNGTLKFKTGIPGCSTAGASTVEAVAHPWLKECLEACGLTGNASTGTVITGSGSTTTVLDVTSAADISVGDLVMVSGEVRLVTAVNTAATPDNITVTPALSGIPAAAVVVYTGVTFKTSDGDPGTATFVVKGDNVLHRLKGCKGTAKFEDVEAGKRPMIAFEFQVDSWDTTEPSGTFPSRSLANHIKTATGGAVLWGSTSTVSAGFSFDQGRTLQEKASVAGTEGRSGWIVADEKPVAGIKPYRSTSYETDFAAMTERSLLLQIGTTAQATFAFFAQKAQITGGQAPIADIGGVVGHDLTLQINDAQQSTLSQWCVVVL